MQYTVEYWRSLFSQWRHRNVNMRTDIAVARLFTVLWTE